MNFATRIQNTKLENGIKYLNLPNKIWYVKQQDLISLNKERRQISPASIIQSWSAVSWLVNRITQKLHYLSGWNLVHSVLIPNHRMGLKISQVQHRGLYIIYAGWSV